MADVKLKRLTDEEAWKAGNGQLLPNFKTYDQLYSNKLTQQQRLSEQLRKQKASRRLYSFFSCLFFSSSFPLLSLHFLFFFLRPAPLFFIFVFLSSHSSALSSSSTRPAQRAASRSEPRGRRRLTVVVCFRARARAFAHVPARSRAVRGLAAGRHREERGLGPQAARHVLRPPQAARVQAAARRRGPSWHVPRRDRLPESGAASHSAGG